MILFRWRQILTPPIVVMRAPWPAEDPRARATESAICFPRQLPSYAKWPNFPARGTLIASIILNIDLG